MRFLLSSVGALSSIITGHKGSLFFEVWDEILCVCNVICASPNSLPLGYRAWQCNIWSVFYPTKGHCAKFNFWRKKKKNEKEEINHFLQYFVIWTFMILFICVIFVSTHAYFDSVVLDHWVSSLHVPSTNGVFSNLIFLDLILQTPILTIFIFREK